MNLFALTTAIVSRKQTLKMVQGCIPKRQNKEYEPKTCDFLLALLDHPEDITYWN